eukprot:TRINITY_DN16475_c0_g1_i1.p1 TRINITY_DN16475_c0_g1~~TRINITY_DN16475_c0_g1_i1.p1  ORF type:complete len:646 (+),score=193.73 TRINITY_DN16475_c0_g1_i1:155-1939(+)
MKLPGTKESVLIETLTGRNNTERQAIKASYKRQFGTELEDDMKAETSQKFEKALVALAKDSLDYDVSQLHQAISGVGTKEKVLIEILSCRTNTEIQAIKAKYQEKHGQSLESAVKGDTSGDFERILVALLSASRNETIKEEKQVDLAEAKREAIALFEAGENKWGTSEKKFIETIVRNSLWENRALISEYKKLGGSSLYEAIESETKGDFREALLAALDPQYYFATRFTEACAGFGTDDSALIRLLRIVPRELLFRVKLAYFNKEKEGLLLRISKETSGDFRRVLLRMACTTVHEYRALMVHECFLGIGTRDEDLIRILAKTPADDLELISEAYLVDYGVKLDQAIEAETSNSYSRFLQAITKRKAIFLAREFERSMRGVGTKDDVLTELLCTRSAAELKAISEAYSAKFNESLVAAVQKETSGNFEKVLLSLLKCQRRVGVALKAGEAEDLADKLHKAAKGLGTDDQVLISILTSYSPEELQIVDDAYEKKTKKDIAKMIKDECSGNYADALLACLDPAGFVGKALKEAMKGVGTDDDAIIRIIAGRTPEQLALVEKRFQEQRKEPLVKWLKEDLSGNFLNAVLAYMGHPILK